MTRFFVLLRRELGATFQSFGFWALLALVSGYTAFFYSQSLEARGFDMDYALIDIRNWLFILTMIITPLLTMRLFAEEKRSGSLELLMTAPVSDGQVVLAKFGAAAIELIVFLAPIWVLHALLAAFFSSTPDWGRLTAVTVGMCGAGFVFLALGTLASALTSIQLWAALLGALLNTCLTSLGVLRSLFPTDSALYRIFAYISLDLHLRSALTGIIDLRDVVLQGTLVALVLFWTVRIVELRKWK